MKLFSRNRKKGSVAVKEEGGFKPADYEVRMGEHVAPMLEKFRAVVQDVLVELKDEIEAVSVSKVCISQSSAHSLS